MRQKRGIRWRTGIGLGLSVLVHALLLVSLRRELDLPGVENGVERVPLTVELGPPVKPQAATAPPSEAATPAAPAVASRPAPATPPRPRPTPPAVASPQSPTIPVPKPADATDMSAMLNAARERRRAAGEPAQPEAPDSQPSRSSSANTGGNEIALQNIQRSVEQGRGREGTSGLFQILEKGPRSARFSFRGWTTDGKRKNWNQVIEVDAGPNGDVERAIVRKMIALIREHHPGDFNWESQRLGRVVPLSARREDNAGLEDFLMREFFGG
jgi:hypothetical protein